MQRHQTHSNLVVEDYERTSGRFHQPRHSRRGPVLVKPRRAVESEPVILLSDDTMVSLYDEQLRPASPTTPLRLRKSTDMKVGQPQDEPRESHLSRPRTSTSSSLAPPTPQGFNADEEAIARVFQHSIVLESVARRAPPQPSEVYRECQVCYEKMDPQDAETCNTCQSSFCVNCIRWYMEYKIIEGEVSEKKMVCPAPQCMRPLSEGYIENFVSSKMFEKFSLYRENQRPGVRFCPRVGCCARIDEPLHSKSRRALCRSCGHESCMRCGEKYHLLATCRRQEKRYGRWRKRSNVRKCPSCKSDIEKQGGCAHMRCFQCDEEFCWTCLRRWETHNETLCVPLSFLRSKDPKFGCCKPIRAVTKTAAVGAALVVGVTGVGVATVVLPPVLLFHWIRSSSRHHKRESLHSDAFIIE